MQLRQSARLVSELGLSATPVTIAPAQACGKLLQQRHLRLINFLFRFGHAEKTGAVHFRAGLEFS